MPERRNVGYLGVDVLNNATICNEAPALLAEGVPLEVASVYRFEKPTFYSNKTLEDLAGRIEHLYPLGLFRTSWDLVRAPFVFGRRFWKALAGAVFCPAEGVKQKFRILFHLLPA